MDLVVERKHFYPTCCISTLAVDGHPAGFVLEDPAREIEGVPVTDWKIPGNTAIPYGRYRVVVNHSQHFQRLLPQLLDVPGFAGVRIHPGNSDKDTEGCLLVGQTWSPNKPDWIGGSRVAFDALFPKIQAALAEGQECWVEIRREAVELSNAT